MKFMLLIYEDEALAQLSRANVPVQEMIAKHLALRQELGSTLVSGAPLKPTETATTVRLRGDSRTIHDGPFAETKEQLAGYYLVDVPDLDTAIGIAKRIPTFGDSSVEVRPVMTPPSGSGA